MSIKPRLIDIQIKIYIYIYIYITFKLKYIPSKIHEYFNFKHCIEFLEMMINN